MAQFLKMVLRPIFVDLIKNMKYLGFLVFICLFSSIIHATEFLTVDAEKYHKIMQNSTIEPAPMHGVSSNIVEENAAMLWKVRFDLNRKQGI